MYFRRMQEFRRKKIIVDQQIGTMQMEKFVL